MSKDPEKRANSLANLATGRAKPGEVRRRPLSHGLPTAAEHLERILLEEFPADELSGLERSTARARAQVQVQIDRSNAAIERSPSLTSRQTTERLKQLTGLLKTDADLRDQGVRATEARLAVARGGRNAQPIKLPSTAERALAVAAILGKVRDPEAERAKRGGEPAAPRINRQAQAAQILRRNRGDR